ncbi:unconventional myosin-XV-like isoform X6 [Eriocheir sinensis]|uniref:unconventional myosin-XV-like isoform X6 n=1 Tax=Eriocheir sinensis TaxID=95602 RepID=UPI0021C626AF|nr:unconventional myosin-XV-like isoform X6 [Eriocheir sinensis]
MEYEKGDLVWFDPGLGYVLPGEVMEFHRAGQVITVQAVIGGKAQVFTLTNLSSVRRRQDLGPTGVDDMISLSDLNEASLLWNLKIRYDKEMIYTYTGSILVAVNPYRMFDIYGLDMVKKYEGQILGTLPPHIFAIGSAAYSRMSKDSTNQCVVISGESGAGKTESTKLIMQYLAAVNKSQSNLITEQILEASPLLESFGNAKTVKNDNSSRFGKYLEVFFKDSPPPSSSSTSSSFCKNGVITGAKITEYLLEKSRIVTQAPEERNYHVFYELLAGLPEDRKAKYGLTTPDKYFYLSQGGGWQLEGKYDGEDFQALLSAMQVLGFTADEKDTIFRILAAVLHLGNIYFHRKQLRHGQEGVEMGTDAEIKWASHLLQIDHVGIKRALTTKITEARNERVFTPLNINQALDARDAVAKALYSSLFSWLVRRVNHIIHKGARKTHISILDIFGFEAFKENSFEQLCINYANEKLQFYFNKHIFKLEQQEYAKEKIDWQSIDFQDNLPVIDLIARKPVGILHLLDDESNFPKATDHSFLEKCHYNHALNELYSRPRLSSMEFGIQHYAGQVWYSVEGFLDKNRDTLRNDVVELLISSKLPMLSEMFLDVRLGSENKTLTKANGRFVTMKPRTPTVSARFNDSLTHLMEGMAKCNPWFVRCIKPNAEKAALKLDMPCVLEQLRYSGMLQTIHIRQQGFPVRLRFSHFAERYRCLIPGQVPRGAPSKEICRAVLERRKSGGASRGSYQLGLTKIFLKEALEQTLEEERYQTLSHSVVTLQRFVRGYLARRRFRAQQRGAVVVQAAVRMWLARRRYRTLRESVVKVQALARGRSTRKHVQRLKEELNRRRLAEQVAKQRAEREAQQNKADQERVQRSVAGVNHLEIPAELAFILSKLGNQEEERGVTRAGAPVRPTATHYSLPHDIDYHAFSKFTSIYFKSHIWGMKREPIKTPFLSKSRDADYSDSLAMFKLILRFMNDPALSGTREVVLGNYIANKGLSNERLRDEIFCQLCNQTWRNENTANSERGWLLLANCLSVFPPSSTLYKYILKYVSDHGLDGFAGLCQRKLLSSHKRSGGVARSCPPIELEWRSNRKKARMALEARFPDSKVGLGEVDSWTTAEEFAANLLQERGIMETSGWTVSLTQDDTVVETPGLEYVLDLIGERELPPSFPKCPSSHLNTGAPSERRVSTTVPLPVVEVTEAPPIDESPVVARRTRSPPALTRKLSREALEAHDQVMNSNETVGVTGTGAAAGAAGGDGIVGLSRTSALNNRYFDDKAKSRSLDNLLEGPPDIQMLGLSRSKLNERYHSVERLVSETSGMVNGQEISAHDLDNMESVSQRGVPKSLSGSRTWNKYDLLEERSAADEETKTEYSRSSSRYIKGGQAGRRGPGGGWHQSARAQLEREYMKSSAMSDTSEAPSLASHVRRVRVPSQASDVDQFLDDLFMPVLNSQLDELSDARSLAASIKGGGHPAHPQSTPELDDLDDSIALARTRQGSFRRQSMLHALQDVDLNESLTALADTPLLAQALKGGGQGAAEVDTGAPTTTAGATFYPNVSISGAPGSPPPFSPPGTLPLYSAGGIHLPGMPTTPQAGNLSPTQVAVQQQHLQRAFLQSAVAQNIQIQQHLMAQNQALQQLLSQSVPVSFQEPEQSELWSTEKAAAGGAEGGAEGGAGSDQRFMGGAPLSPPPPLVMPGTMMASPPMFSQAAALSSPIAEQTQKKHSNASDDAKMLHDYSMVQPSSGQPHGQLLSPTESPWGGVVPPPPPMPTHLNPEEMAAGGFMDPYQRAKTVRIGKWRWPPPKGEEDPNDSFLQFKIRQQSKRMSKQHDGRDGQLRQNSQESFTIEWEEFEVGGPNTSSSAEPSPRKESSHQHMTQHQQSSQHTAHQSSQHYSHQSSQHASHQFSQHMSHQSQHSAHQSSQQHTHQTNGHAHNTSKDKIDGKEKGARKRRDSWGNPVDDGKSKEGIGKLKISREMREKLEAVTSSHPSRTQKGPVMAAAQQQQKQQRGIKKLEAHRRNLLQHQLEGDKWGDTVNSVKMLKPEKGGSVPPPPPVAPANMFLSRRPPSPTQSLSSQESTPVIPQPRSPPPPIQPPFRSGVAHDFDSGSERRQSVSTMHTEKTEHFELEESSEFLPSVDSAPVLIDEELEKRSYEGLKTHLLPAPHTAHLTYTRHPWSLALRKELFAPGEVLHGEALHLVFCQVVLDVYSGTTPRITAEQRAQMRKMLDNRGITPNNTFSPHHKSSLKREIIELAKTWPLYFAAIFPVTGSRKTGEVEMLAVSHSGVKLLRKEHGHHLTILSSYNRVEEAECGRSGSLKLVVGSGSSAGTRVILHTPRAKQIAALLTKYLSIETPGSREYVRAVADYRVREGPGRDHSLLCFRKGDIIRVTGPDRYGENGWLQGAMNGRSGLFPVDYVVPIGRAEARSAVAAAAASKTATTAETITTTTVSQAQVEVVDSLAESEVEVARMGGGGWTQPEPPHQTLNTTHSTIHLHGHHDDSGHSSGGEGGGMGGPGSVMGVSSVEIGGHRGSSPPVVHDGKHSLLQFALQHFRVSKEQGIVQPDGTLQTKTKKKKANKDSQAGWTWKEQVEMVKFSQSPLSASLLPLEAEQSQVAVESFLAVMRYMGDYPMAPQQTEVHCVYTILMNCHKNPVLRDEVYCQIMKQTTNNKSSIPDSCQRGWRLFSILAAYFTCSDTLKPYLFKYLETAAYDKRRAYHGTAMVCLQNLRKTFNYGGRKNVPSIEEITAITAGRNSKRQIYRLPGGTERVINTKSTSVVQDIIEEMCNLISVRSTQEQEEYSLYCIVEGDTFTMPLAREEYILDVTTELLKNQQVFYLIFCRSVWYYPLRLDNPLYYEVVFNQIAPDYLEGLLLVTPGEQLQQEVIYDIAKVAALLHRAADLEEVPTMKEVKYLLPKPALTVRDVKPPQWVNMVQSAWPEVASLTSLQAKAQVLEILQSWPLFGSSFFAVKRVMEPKERTDYILALNKNGVHFLDLVTHETITRYTLAEVMSTRKVKSEDELFLDMKCGNLMQQRITRIQTDQAHEISRLIRQYITIEQRVTGHARGDHPRDVTLSR